MMYELTNKKERKKKKKKVFEILRWDLRRILEMGFDQILSCEVAEIWEWKEGEKENREKRESERRNDKVWSEWLFLLCEVYVRKWHLREANRKENRERMRKQKRKN